MTTSFPYGAGTGTLSAINSLDPTGFTVGVAPETNAATVAYHYVAFNEVPGTIKRGTYVGNNTDNRGIATVGFQPAYMLVRADDNVTGRPAVARPSSLAGDNTLLFTATAMSANQIQALQANGFQLGTSANINANTVTYYYLAVRSSAP